jgi:hypothetical protein
MAHIRAAAGRLRSWLAPLCANAELVHIAAGLCCRHQPEPVIQSATVQRQINVSRRDIGLPRLGATGSFRLPIGASLLPAQRMTTVGVQPLVNASMTLLRTLLRTALKAPFQG